MRTSLPPLMSLRHKNNPQPSTNNSPNITPLMSFHIPPPRPLYPHPKRLSTTTHRPRFHNSITRPPSTQQQQHPTSTAVDNVQPPVTHTPPNGSPLTDLPTAFNTELIELS
ncbi:unnamed protein product [Adineta steineri]|uniref:Uncharacterized protein n=1 Tax=Adineta steineri TaxID=433720 RepID=A0A813VW73_9BILA|nr:unnamed protein product [Adineta steineri]